MMQEFKAFALRGNVLDLAVGVMIGAAFQGVVGSLTDNILAPIIGLFAGQSFAALQVELFGVPITYGAFITDVINFIIMAFVIFLIVRSFAKLAALGHAEEAPPPVTEKACPFCASQIPLAAVRCPACTSLLEEQAE